MNPNIMNPKKYKTISIKNKQKKDKLTKMNIKQNRYKKRTSNLIDNKATKKSSNAKGLVVSKGLPTLVTIIKLAFCLMAIVVIGYLSSFLVSQDNNPFLSVFGNDDDASLVINDAITIGVKELDVGKNILVTELKRYATDKMITYDSSYVIEYKIASKITKITDTVYEITLKDVAYADSIIATIYKLKSSQDSLYYKALSNVEKVEKKEAGMLKLTLYQPNPYIVYALDFSIENEAKNVVRQNTTPLPYFMNALEKSVTFERNDEVLRDTVKRLSFTNYEDNDILVSDFRNRQIDMFLTSSEEDIRLIGKHEYNIKQYRDGETLFLLGNKESPLFKLIEVRKALAYCLNRNEIAKNIENQYTEIIDIPYIYSDIKYKYDIYGAENSLIAASWHKVSGIYSKNTGYHYQVLALSLLVNQDDPVKIKVADQIKEMVSKIGIKITIEKLTNEQIKERVKNNSYDLVLSTVYLTNNPDITFLTPYLAINEEIQNKMNLVNVSTVQELPQNILALQNTISEQVACIGLIAKKTNVVYQKNIVGFEDITYMNLFKNLNKIGKSVAN